MFKKSKGLKQKNLDITYLIIIGLSKKSFKKCMGKKKKKRQGNNTFHNEKEVNSII